MELHILALLTAFFIVLLSTPALIKVAFLKGLIDEPGDERKLHDQKIPSIGGIIIFAGTIFTYALWYTGPPENLKYIVSGCILLFFVGIKDDIIGTAPVKKLVAHVIVGLMIVLMADVRITSLYGLFNIREIPEWASVFLSLYAYIVIVNAFNLSDGVDGLASAVGVIASMSFFIYFSIAGDFQMALLAISLAGALLAFLIYNFSPAKIFMGDSGSLTVGFIFAFLAIRMIEYKSVNLPSELIMVSKPILALAILVYPLIDTLRIFIYRLVKGSSPFSADKNHLHHRLLDIGLTHRQTVGVIALYNIVIVASVFLLQGTSTTLYFLLVAGLAIALAQIPFFFTKTKNKVPELEKV